MDEAAVIIAGAVALVVVGAAIAVVAYLRDPWRRLVRRRALVVLSSDVTIEGILWARRGPLLVLRDAKAYIGNGTEGRAVDGEMVIERDRIEWMQVIR